MSMMKLQGIGSGILKTAAVTGNKRASNIIISDKRVLDTMAKYKDSPSFQKAFKKIDELQKSGHVFDIKELASGGCIISTVDQNGKLVPIAADCHDFTKTFSQAVEKVFPKSSTALNVTA